MGKDIHTLFLMFDHLRKILNKNQKMQIGGIAILILMGSFCEMLGVSSVLPFIESILTPEQLSQKWYMEPIVKLTRAKTSLQVIVACGALIVMVYIFKNVFLTISAFIQSKFRCRFQKDLSTGMLRAYLKKPYDYFLNINSAEVIRGIGGDVFGTFEVLHNLFLLSSEVMTVVMIGIFIIYTDAIMAVGVLFIAGICFTIITLSFKPVLSKVGRNQRIANADRSKYAYQAIMGIKEIKVMQRDQAFIDNYDDAYEEQRKTDIAYELSNALPEKIIETVCITGLIVVVCIRLKMGVNVATFVTQLSTFALAAFRILPSVSKMTGYLNSLVYYRLSLEAVYENMIDLQKYEEREKVITKYVDTKEVDLKFRKTLKCKNVCWQYENTNDYVLRDLCLTIHKGEAVAFIGTSGAGKTTLSDCILGLLQPQEGKIEIDGVDVFSIPQKWSQIVGYVPQTVFLTDDTVRANITFGLPKAEWDDDKIWRALEQAQLKTFIEKMPNGLDTLVGERGVKFSGGQRQRIAIARALYYNPEILVLDEATSALDNETETAVMESIEALQGHKTLIIVAHRLTTIRNCDKIFEIKDGKAWLRDKEEVFEKN